MPFGVSDANGSRKLAITQGLFVFGYQRQLVIFPESQTTAESRFSTSRVRSDFSLLKAVVLIDPGRRIAPGLTRSRVRRAGANGFRSPAKCKHHPLRDRSCGAPCFRGIPGWPVSRISIVAGDRFSVARATRSIRLLRPIPRPALIGARSRTPSIAARVPYSDIGDPAPTSQKCCSPIRECLWSRD
jgi:hypothetical protein